MRKLLIVIIGAVILLLTAASLWFRPDLRLKSASGITSHVLCSAAFVSKIPPEEAYNETVLSLGAMPLVSPGLRYKVDATHKTVETTILGGFHSRAVYREGFGCHLDYGQTAAITEPAQAFVPLPLSSSSSEKSLLTETDPQTPVEPANAALKAALDKAFFETTPEVLHRTKAFVVVHHGQVVAERYAQGIPIDTQLMSWSMAKSMTNAMIGVLVQQGRFKALDPAPIAPWRREGDAHAAITIDMLLRQTSGIAIPQTNTGDDASSRMKYTKADMAGFAIAAPMAYPAGSHWSYSDGNSMILSRIVRDAAGGKAQDVRGFFQRELFAPLGMAHTTLEFDEAETPLGAYSFYASARDWARFGQLYLQDGKVGDKQILPPGWVNYSTTRGVNPRYGAGFWLNPEKDAESGAQPWASFPHLPHDAFMARGLLGQYVVIIPSEDLIIVRLGPSSGARDDAEFMDGVFGDIIAAVHA